MNPRFGWLALLASVSLMPAARSALPPVPVNGFGIVAIIPLPGVSGRIDHLAYDPVDQLVFVAELGNNTVAVVNVATRQVEKRITGFTEPQGVAYSAMLERLYVASADGTIKSFRRDGFIPDKTVDIGADADNVRADDDARRLYVGHGDGALAVLDAKTLASIADIPLRAHPESFQLVPGDARIVVNLPHANEIALVDRTSTKPVGRWPNEALKANYPLAIDAQNGRVLSVFRQPARIVSRDLARGAIAANEPTCADADDVFVDERRQRVYVVCGEGVVEVLSNPALQRIARLPTSPGARTGLFRADADRLFVAARANGASPAALWVLAPAP